jgi:hypothetical protein
MADPITRASSTATPDDFRAVIRDEIKRFHAQMENAIDGVYQLGLEHGDAAAIARILKAANSDANGPAPDHEPRTPRPNRTQGTKPPGEATHKLIEAVLRATPLGKASPTEVRTSPLNKSIQIKRDAIRNAMRRGRKSGRYVSDGKGRYSLGKTEAQK